jgi:tRNA-splicing ligase RtcB
MGNYCLNRIGPSLWEIPPSGKMLVPARIYANQAMIRQASDDHALEQVANVAQLPGIVGASLAMPDIHCGYGFPVGGVAAFRVDEGVVSPGGVGYDINCGVRLMAAKLQREDISGRVSDLMSAILRLVPSGIGSEGTVPISRAELDHVAVGGARWLVSLGMGTDDDLEYTEDGGCVDGCDPEAVSTRARQRGVLQLGTLGTGNHFVELGYVADVHNAVAAGVIGLELGQVTILIHSGSRGFGHQICDDYLIKMDALVRRQGIALPDRQLACAPVSSEDGQSYLRAMRCASNYAFANRQLLAHRTREAFEQTLGLSRESIGLRTVYDLGHNTARIESHLVDGKQVALCVHRKGATRAYGPGDPHTPAAYRRVGQPVLVPGAVGRDSFVLLGTPHAVQATFGSACHGAGRMMSRQKAQELAAGEGDLDGNALVVGENRDTVRDELAVGYKDASAVVDVCVTSGLATTVARICPLGCRKG